MTLSPLVLIVSVLPLLWAIASEAQTVEWRDAAQMEIEGRGWTDTDTPYARLPARAHGVVPESVWDLAHHSAGLAVRFQTDAPQVSVRWTITGSIAMPHMPATGVSGVDLYVRNGDGHWIFAQNGRPEASTNTAQLAPVGKPGLHECLLYLPLYNGLTSLEIGVPSGSRLEAAPARPPARRGAIVVYGTSIAQGGCASRPGMAWPAILGRMLDRPVINLGFSGSGRMEPAVASLLAELDPALFVVDCLWNVGDLGDAALTERIKGLARTIRAARPNAPILFVGQSHIRTGEHPTHMSRVQAQAVRDLEAEGMHGLFVADGAPLLGKDAEGTVDGVHPNDLGMLRQAEALAPVVRRCLSRR